MTTAARWVFAATVGFLLALAASRGVAITETGKTAPGVYAPTLLSLAQAQDYKESPHADVARERRVTARQEITARIAATRPDDPKLADLYDELGSAESMLDNHAGSIAAYREALRVKPSAKGYLFDIAIEQYSMGDNAGADATFAEVLRVPHDPGKAHVAAFYFLATGRYARVIEIAEREMGPSTRERVDADYALYGTIAQHALGGDAKAWLANRGWSAEGQPWPAPVVEHLRGGITEAQLVDAMRAAPQLQQKLCEALFYVGLDLEARGQAGLARRYYEATVATHVNAFLEYQGAARKLEKPGAK